MQVPYNFQQVINNNQYQVINGVKCFPVSMLDENFNYLCKVVNVGSTAPTISYDGQFWFDGTTLKIAQSSSWVDIKVASAVNADKVGGLLPSQFLRSDQNTTCSGNVTAQQFISQTTTNPPFVVSSNRLVTNLCADYLDGYHLDPTGAVTGQLVQFDTTNIKLSAAPIYVVSGNVGIGTASPSYKLDVAGHIRSVSLGYVYIHSAGSDTDPSYIRIINTASSTTNPYVSFGYGSYPGICGVYMAMSDKSLRLNISKTSDGLNNRDAIIIPPANGTQTACIIPGSGGGYNADWPSGWGGGISTLDICCAGVYYSTLSQRSDLSIKTDVQPLSDYLQTDCLDVISCLKPVKYAYVDDPLKTNRFGFIAQDVSEICPELVTVDTEGKASLNYMDLIALLTKGIQELYDMLGKVIQKIGGIS